MSKEEIVEVGTEIGLKVWKKIWHDILLFILLLILIRIICLSTTSLFGEWVIYALGI